MDMLSTRALHLSPVALRTQTTSQVITKPTSLKHFPLHTLPVVCLCNVAANGDTSASRAVVGALGGGVATLGPA